MTKYIDAEKLKYEIERRKLSNYYTDTDDYEAELFEIIGSLQQEQPEESASDGLEEAADEHVNNIAYCGDDIELEKEQSKRDFIAGAKWQAKQLLKGSPMPEDTALFNKGVEEGKRLMMEEAVEGEITKDNRGNNVLRVGLFNNGFEIGDKVRVIVLPQGKLIWRAK